VARVEAMKNVTLGCLTKLCYRYPTFYGFDYQASGVLVLKGENITRDGDLVEADEPNYITEQIHARFPMTHLEAGDLIVSVRGEVGKVGIVPERFAGSNINANTIRISLNDRARGKEFTPEFLWLFLNSELGQLLIGQFIAGGVQETITAPELLEVRIPKLNLESQQELVSAMDVARAERQAKLAEADALLAGVDAFLVANLGLTLPPKDDRKVFAARLKDARHQLHLNADYFHPERILALRVLEASSRRAPCAKLAEVVSFIRDQIKTPGPNYISLAHVQSNTGELVNSIEEAAGACSEFQTEDVLFARLRPYLNKVYRAEMDGCCSPEFHVLRVNNAHELLPDYLAAILRSSLTLAQTRHMMTGNTHPRLTNEDVINLVIPIPKDLGVQEAIATEVRRRRDKARRLRADAEGGWRAAKRRFEEQLLSPAQP
jgi:type I restriction enzyme S subunit